MQYRYRLKTLLILITVSAMICWRGTIVYQRYQNPVSALVSDLGLTEFPKLVGGTSYTDNLPDILSNTALIKNDSSYTLKPVYFHTDRYCWQQLWTWGGFSMEFDHVPNHDEVEDFRKNATQFMIQSTNKPLVTKPSNGRFDLR